MKDDSNLLGKKIYLHILTLVLVCAALVFTVLLPAAFAAERKVVKVGYDGMLKHTPAGVLKEGYGYDSYQKLAAYTGWEYEYYVASFDDVMKKLESGEIDAFLELTYNEERAKFLYYSTVTQGHAQYYLMTDINNDALQTIDDIAGKRVGVLRSSFSERTFRKYIEEHGIDCEIIPYDKDVEAVKSITENKVDAVFSFPNNVIGNDYLRLKFVGPSIASQPFYFVVSKKRPDLYRELELALQKMQANEPNALHVLYNEYVVESAELPADAQHWLKQHQTLRVGYVEEMRPYLFKDVGNERGVLVDILREFARKLNISLHIEAYEDYEAMGLALRKGEIDMVMPVFANNHFLEANHLAITNNATMTTGRMLYANKHDTTNPQIAIPEKNKMLRYAIEANYPQAAFITMSTLDNCLEAVKQGHADGAFVLESFYVHDQMKRPAMYEGLRTVEYNAVPFNLAFGVERGNSDLLNLLNYEIKTLENGFAQKRVVEYSQYEAPVTLQTILRQYSMPIIGTGIFTMGMMGWLFYLYIVSSRRKQRRLEEAKAEAEQANEEVRQYLSRIEALSDIYFVSLYVDLDNNTYEAIKIAPWVASFLKKNGQYSDLGKVLTKNFVYHFEQNATYHQLSRASIREHLSLNNSSGTKRSFFWDYQIKREGQVVWVRATISPVNFNADGTPHQVLVLFQDINNDKEMALTDSLTGVFNRSYGEAFINDFVLSSKLKCGAFAIVDIDDFKQVNDKFGHQKGDEVLQHLAVKLSNTLSKDCVICRIGGDEFIVYQQVEQFDRAVQNLETLCKQMNIRLKKDNEYWQMSLSVGIVEAPRYGTTFMELYSKADQASYYSKQHGKNGITIYSDELLAQDSVGLLLKEFDKALANHDIKVYYQPVIDTTTGKLISMEALSRWIDPERGLLSPKDFIPFLEQQKQISRLDLYVVEEICRTMQFGILEGKQIIPVSFNLSRYDFLNVNIFEEIEKIVTEYRIPHEYLYIEITESVVMENPEIVKSDIKQFHDAGYQVWMDDFGSAYSSLNMLQEFDFDEIKLDQAFLRNFDERAKIIVSSIITMANKLHIHTLAEGVETKEQYDFLCGIGCEKIQGYYCGRPMPLADTLKHCEEQGRL